MFRGAAASYPRVIARLAPIGLWLGVALLAWCLTPQSARAQDLKHPLTTCIVRNTGQDALGMLRRSGGFDCARTQSDFGPGDYWARTPDLSPTLDPDLTRVRYSNQWQRGVTLYGLYRDGHAVVLPLVAADMPQHLQVGAVIEQALPRRAAPLQRIMWRLDGATNVRRLVSLPHLDTPADSAQDNLRSGVTYAALGGLGIALLTYNLALWVGLRRRFQLAYCVMVACLVLYAGAQSGVIGWSWPGLPIYLRTSASYVLLAISSAAALWFARTFFEPDPLPRWLHRSIDLLIVALLGTAFLFAAMAPAHMYVLDKIHGLTYVALLIVTLPLLNRARARGPLFLTIFALGWTAPVMLAAMRVSNTYGMIAIPFYLDADLLLILGGQALLSSLAIAYRIHLLSRERDEAREQEIAARLLAATDPLTGLLNRRAFLEHVIDRDGPQRLLLVDIDHFKRVNETIGHDGGDEVLRVVARALRAAVPPEALIARIGGEEFAILAPDESSLAADIVLDSLRAQRMPFDLSVTASIGACTGPLIRDVDWKALYRQADRALFEAKAAGRDRARNAVEIAVAA